MSESISVNNSLARDHAERIRRQASSFVKAKDAKDSYHGGYTALTASETCYGDLLDAIPKLMSKLQEDCNNLARVADVWKDEDKYIADKLSVDHEMEYIPGSNVHL